MKLIIAALFVNVVLSIRSTHQNQNRVGTQQQNPIELQNIQVAPYVASAASDFDNVGLAEEDVETTHGELRNVVSNEHDASEILSVASSVTDTGGMYSPASRNRAAGIMRIYSEHPVRHDDPILRIARQILRLNQIALRDDMDNSEILRVASEALLRQNARDAEEDNAEARATAQHVFLVPQCILL